MADPSTSAGEDDFAEENEGGGESTVAMASPQRDPAVPLPISVPPPPMHAGPHGNGQMQVPTAPVPFLPGMPGGFPGGGPAAFPVHARPPAPPAPSLPTPIGGVTPQPPAGRPLAAAGMPPPTPPAPGVAGAFTGSAGLKRPQTVIGLAPPPVGAPRPGSPGAGRVPLPSGRGPGGAPRPPANGPAEKPPPSSGRGVRPPALPIATPAPSPAATNDADSTDEQLAMPDGIPDSQKEEMPTMAKSAEESLALFGLGVDAGLTNAARSAVAPKPGAPPVPAAGRPMPPPPPLQRPAPSPGAGAVESISEMDLGEIEHTTALPRIHSPAAGAPPPPPVGATPLPVLHDRTEEEESTRAVSRAEMLRGHDAVIVGGEDGESAQGEDATLAVAPGFNEASKNLAAFAATMTEDPAAQGQHAPEQQGGFPPPPYGQQPHPMDPSQSQPYNQQPWQDPNAQQQAPQQWSQQPQDPNAYPQQQHWQNGPPSYPMGSIGPVSGPHMPVANQYAQSNPMGPQSSPHLQVPQSGHMQQAGYPQASIPHPGQPMVHQAPHNPFGDWNANAPPPKKKFVLSGQVLLLAIVGTVCLAIFITGIVLFATTKF